jgi:hypothetical protein
MIGNFVFVSSLSRSTFCLIASISTPAGETLNSLSVGVNDSDSSTGYFTEGHKTLLKAVPNLKYEMLDFKTLVSDALNQFKSGASDTQSEDITLTSSSTPHYADFTTDTLSLTTESSLSSDKTNLSDLPDKATVLSSASGEKTELSDYSLGKTDLSLSLLLQANASEKLSEDTSFFQELRTKTKLSDNAKSKTGLSKVFERQTNVSENLINETLLSYDSQLRTDLLPTFIEKTNMPDIFDVKTTSSKSVNRSSNNYRVNKSKSEKQQKKVFEQRQEKKMLHYAQLFELECEKHDINMSLLERCVRNMRNYRYTHILTESATRLIQDFEKRLSTPYREENYFDVFKNFVCF